MLSFFPLDVLDEIWDVIESVSEGFLTSSSICVRDTAWFLRLYGEMRKASGRPFVLLIFHSLKRVDYRPYKRRIVFYLTCIMISSVDLVRYGISRAKDLSIWEWWHKQLLRHYLTKLFILEMVIIVSLTVPNLRYLIYFIQSATLNVRSI